MTALENFQEYTSHCPKQHPYNNKLRREHKTTISKVIRKKREDEIFRYIMSSEMLNVTQAYVEELMSQYFDKLYEDFVEIKDLKLGDAAHYTVNLDEEGFRYEYNRNL